MRDVFNDETLNGWILTPAGNLVEYVAEEQKTCGTTMRGYGALGCLPSLLGLLDRHLPEDLNQIRVSLQVLAKDAPSDAAFAQQEIDIKFATIFAHHTIAVWAAVETTLEQILVSYLVRTPDSDSLLAKLAPSLKAGKMKTDTLRRTKLAVRMWEATLDDRSTIGRSLAMLAAVGVHTEISKQAQQSLDEMSEVRNIILHRAGFLDETFTEKCPWFEMPSDGRLRIDQPMMNFYFSAAGELAIALIGAIVSSPHIQTDP